MGIVGAQYPQREFVIHLYLGNYWSQKVKILHTFGYDQLLFSV